MNLPPGPSGPRLVHTRPLHTRPTVLALVWLGGALGTSGRFLAGEAVPGLAGVPVATFGVNVLGAFALGVLLERLAHPGPHDGRRTVVRLAAGSGFLGGLTTYSALSLDAVELWTGGRPGLAAAYGLGSLLIGALTCWLGILAGSRLARPRPVERRRPR